MYAHKGCCDHWSDAYFKAPELPVKMFHFLQKISVTSFDLKCPRIWQHFVTQQIYIRYNVHFHKILPITTLINQMNANKEKNKSKNKNKAKVNYLQIQYNYLYHVFKFYIHWQLQRRADGCFLQLYFALVVQTLGWPWESFRVLLKNRFLNLAPDLLNHPLQGCGPYLFISYSPLGSSECIRFGNQCFKVHAISTIAQEVNTGFFLLYSCSSVTIWTLKSRVHKLKCWCCSIKM